MQLHHRVRRLSSTLLRFRCPADLQHWGGLSGEFSALYSRMWRPSIPPEKLRRAMLSQAFYSIRSERHLMDRLEFDLLFRWFVGIGVDDTAWDHSTFEALPQRAGQGGQALLPGACADGERRRPFGRRLSHAG